MPENVTPRKCNFDAATNKTTLCPDMARQVNRENAGDVFDLVYIEGSLAIMCHYNKTVLYYCPFCGVKLRDMPDYSENRWRI